MSEIKPTPEQIHQLEQRWAHAETMVEAALKALQETMPQVSEATGLSDASIVFDYVYAFILSRELQGDSHRFTVAMCAAALTKLARASRADEELLAQLDKEIKDDEH